MSRPSRPLPDSLGDAFSVRAASQAGVTERRLRNDDLETPFRGTRMRRPGAAEPDASAAGALDSDRAAEPEHGSIAREAELLRAEITRLAAVFATIAPVDWFFSHITAAVLWGLPLPIRVLRLAVRGDPKSGIPPRGIDVAVLGRRRGSRAAGLSGHQLKPALTAVRVRDGVRLASPAAVWAQLAPLLTVDELIELGDAIVRIPRRRGMERGEPSDALGTIAELASVMNAGRRTGIAKLRETLPQIRVGSSSPPETRVRLACVRAGLPEPDLDIDVLAADGTPIGYTELAYVAYRQLFEYEGDHHRTDPDQWNRDIDKHAACVAAGWDVTRLTARHVYPTAAPAVDRIRAALLRAGWLP